MHIIGSKTLIQEHRMDSEATVTTIITQEISRNSTNLDIGLQSGAGIIGHLTGLVHHLHLLYNKIHVAKSLPGGTRWVVWSLVCSEE